MKLVTAGLISFLVGCAQNPIAAQKSELSGVRLQAKPTFPREIRNIVLSKISGDPDFAQIADGLFQFKEFPFVDVKIRRIQFKNSRKAQLYLQNRKVFLDQTFKNNVSPYFGVIEVDPTCYNLAQTEAREKKNSSQISFYMQFPMSNRDVISDCIGGPVEGVSRYDFFLCRKTHTVYEIVQFRKKNQSAIVLQANCE